MKVPIQVYIDFVCPFCYLGRFPLLAAAAGKEVTLEWVPFELRPEGREPLDPREEPMMVAAWQQFIEPTAKAWELPMKLPNIRPFPRTDKAFEGLQYAKEQGKGHAYVERMFKAFFEEERNIGDTAVLAELAEEIGLNKMAFRYALDEGDYREKHAAAIERGKRNNVTSVPYYIIGNTALKGLKYQEEIDQAITDELNRRRQHS